MKKNKLFTTLIGFAAMTFTLSLNYRYASNNYGILENTLSAHVLAASNCEYCDPNNNSDGSSSESGSNSSGSGIKMYKHVPTDEECILKVSETTKVGVPPYVVESTTSYEVSGKYHKCADGYDLIVCHKKCEGDKE